MPTKHIRVSISNATKIHCRGCLNLENNVLEGVVGCGIFKPFPGEEEILEADKKGPLRCNQCREA